jgi:hypothetical protein
MLGEPGLYFLYFMRYLWCVGRKFLWFLGYQQSLECNNKTSHYVQVEKQTCALPNEPWLHLPRLPQDMYTNEATLLQERSMTRSY